MKRIICRTRILPMVVTLLVTSAYLFPIYWMFVSGLKTPDDIFRFPPKFIPEAISSDSVRAAFQAGYLRYLRNSLVIALTTTLVTFVLTAPAAYAVARLQSELVKWMLLLFLVAQLLPPVLMATPLFVIFRGVGLINRYLAVILANATLTVPFSIIMLRPVFIEIPLELEEAAFIDGAHRHTVLLRIVIPMARNGFIIVGVLTFIFAYQDFIYALSFLPNQNLHPTTVGLHTFIGAQAIAWNRVMAFASLSSLPLVILFVVLQKQIMRGITSGAIK